MSEHRKSFNESIVANDGSFLGSVKSQAIKAEKNKIDFDNAWKSQKVLLKNSIVKLYKDKTAIGVQWQSYIDWDNSRVIEPNRIKRSLNALGKGKFPHTAKAVNNAIAIAQEIDLKIQADSFSWQDYPQWLPKDLRPKDAAKERGKTIAEWIEEYEAYYWLSRNKSEYRNFKNWDKGYLRYFKKISDWTRIPSQELFDEVCRNYPKSKKRNECCTRIKYLAQFCGLIDYDPKEFRLAKNQIKVKAKAKRELTDAEIEVWYKKFSEWTGQNSNPSQWGLWRWMFGLQATYGFRNHETLNIFNLTEGCQGDDGKWYDAFIDQTKNPRGIIYTEGKGVKRAAFLPRPLKWLDEFSLRDIPQDYYKFMKGLSGLSGFEKAKRKDNKLQAYNSFLREHGFTFTAYNLRHHYNVKSHHAGIPASIIAKNLGHTLLMNGTLYLESQGVKSCLDTINKIESEQQEINNKEQNLQQQFDSLKQENEQLKALLQQLLESLKTQND